MSYRNEDPNILTWLQRLQARVDQLERSSPGVRQNDLRLGNILLEPDEEFNRFRYKNLKTGEVKLLHDTDQSWSWPGAINTTTVTSSPVYTMARNCAIREIIVAVLVPSASDITINFYIESVARVQDITLPAGLTTKRFAPPITANRLLTNQRLWFDLVTGGVSDTGENLSVTVRFDG